MRGPLAYVRRAFEMPPRQAARAAAHLAIARWSELRQRIALESGTAIPGEAAFARRLGFAGGRSDALAAALFRSEECVLPVQWSDAGTGFDAERILAAAGDVLDHRFDLLGSGPVRVTYDLEAAGLAEHVYRMAPGRDAAVRQAARMNALITGSAAGYEPIDWHVDFRSGYRWSERQWSARTKIGHLPGVDVKVPWELSRFQHAPVLGLAWRLDPESAYGRRAPAEFCAQVIDWIAANPFARGPNWSCPMDVALRAVGWLTGLALLNEARALTPAFRWLLARSLHAHGMHIETNLEYHRSETGNHYLSNVVGLLCIGAALPELPESARWCCFGAQELVSEMERQVLPDGGDIEGSVPYHHLVAELFLLGTLVALRLPRSRRAVLRDVRPGRMLNPLAPRIRPPGERQFDPARDELFPPWYLDRLLRMAELSAAVMKPDGRIPLIGDNDDGRAIRITPPELLPGRSHGDDPADRRIVTAVAARLFERPELAGHAGADADAMLLVKKAPVQAIAQATLFARAERQDPPRIAGVGSTLDLYADTGIAIARAGRLYLVISFGTVPPMANGGHFHNDLLGFELQWDGIDFIVDGGTWVYTPVPALRDAFRSVRAHSTVVVPDREQRTWPTGPGRLFAVKQDAAARILTATSRALAIEVRYADVRHVRRWEWTPDSVRITDEIDSPEAGSLLLNLHPDVRIHATGHGADSPRALTLDRQGRRAELRIGGVGRLQTGPSRYSPAYGIRIASTCVEAALTGSSATTHFAFNHTARTSPLSRSAYPEEMVR